MSNPPLNPPNPTDPLQNQPEQPPKPKKRRRWPIVLLALVVLLVLLVLLLPAILSTALGRGIAEGQINKRINGTVKIDDWSLGWFSGISLQGVKVYDKESNLLLVLNQFKTQLNLSRAARGDLRLGDTLIDVDLKDIRVNADGTTNLDGLAPPAAPSAPTPHEPGPPKAPGPVKAPEPASLPNVSGNITINLQGNIGGAGVPAPVHIDPSTIAIQIPDINQPISNDIKLVYRVGEGKASTITLKGSADVSENNKLDAEHATVTQNLALSNVDLSAINAVMKSMGQTLQTSGIASGGIDLSMKGQNDINANGAIKIANLQASGGPLKGDDKFVAADTTIPIKASTSVVNGGTFIKVEQTGIVMKAADGAQLLNVNVTANAPQDSLVAALQLIPQVIDRTLMGKTDEKIVTLSGDGTAQVSATADVNRLAQMFHNTAGLQPEMKLTKGSFTHTTTVTIAKSTATIATSTELPDLAGTNGGKPVTLSPIKLTAGLSAVGGDKPDLQNLAVDFSSGFLTAKGGGPTLAQIKIDGGFDAAKLQAQAGQFVNLDEIVNPGLADKHVVMTGTGAFSVSTNGDLIREGGTTKTNASITLSKINISGVKELPPIAEDNLSASIDGDLQRGKQGENFVTGWKNVVVKVLSGTAQSPVLALNATANVNMSPLSVPQFETSLSVPNVQQVQQKYAAFVPAMAENKIDVTSGSVAVAVAGAYQNDRLLLSKPLNVSLANISISKGGNPVLSNETITVNAQGDVGLKKTSAKLSQLAVTSSSNLFSLSKSADQDFVVNVDDKGQLTGSGAVQMTAALKKLNDLNVALTSDPKNAAQMAKAGNVQSGDFAATLKIASDPKGTNVNLDGGIKNLSVTTNDQPLKNETVTINLTAMSPPDLSGMMVNGKIGSSLATATISDTNLKLGGTTFDLVQKASIDVSTKDLPRLQAVATAFAPPATQPADPAAPPIVVSSGAASFKLNVSRANGVTTVTMPEARVTKLDLKRGKESYRFNRDKDITFALIANIKDKPGKTLIDQIDSIEVPTLSGDLRIATLSMPQKVVITNLSSDAPSAAGSVQINSNLDDDFAKLMQFIQQKEFLYQGVLQITENLKSSGNTISLDGDGGITKFQVLNAQPSGQVDKKPTVAFTEDKITITNGIDADLKAHNLNIRGVQLQMPQSQALGVNLVGKVNDWQTKRAFDGTKLDLSYDLAKIWPIIYPMMSPEQQENFKGTKIAGKYTKTFNVTGSYPAMDKGKALKPEESLRYVTAEGSVNVDLLNTWNGGIDLQQLEVPVLLRGGKVQTIYPDKSKTYTPAKLNGGTLDLSEIVYDMREAEPRLTIDKGKQLLKGVSINDALGEKLGKFINPVFADMKQSKGLMDVTIEYCDAVALGDGMKTAKSGKAKILLSLTDLDITSNFVAAAMAGPNSPLTSEQAGAYQADVKNGVVELNAGRTTQNIDFQLKEVTSQPQSKTTIAQGKAVRTKPPKPLHLTFDGTIVMATLKQDLKMNVPAELMGPTIESISFGKVKAKDVVAAFPTGIPVRLRGTTQNSEFDWGNFAAKVLEGQLTNGLLGGGDKKDGKDTGGDLLKGILGGGDKSNKPAEKPKK